MQHKARVTKCNSQALDTCILTLNALTPNFVLHLAIPVPVTVDDNSAVVFKLYRIENMSSLQLYQNTITGDTNILPQGYAAIQG